MNTATPDDADQVAPLVAAAQALLSTTLKAGVQLTNVEILSEEGRRNRIVRCAVAGAAPGQPASVIIKQVVAEKYDPEDGESWDTQRFFHDWAGAAFLSAVSGAAAYSPRLYGGDRAGGFIILEDLGVHRSLVEPLLAGDASQAEGALLAFAAQLGSLHADTIGAAGRFEQIMSAINPAADATVEEECRQNAAELRARAGRLRDYLDRLGVPIAAGFNDDLALICDAIGDPGAFLAYIHGDPCPDNVFYADGRVRLIDFEFARFGHALEDGAYGRMMFPTCWCANQIPAPVLERMERAYRAALARACPPAQDADLFAAELVLICGYWLIGTLARLLERGIDEDSTWGIATVRERVVARLEAFIATSARRGDLPALRKTASGLLEYLQARWPDTRPLALYPAFRG